jgi:predicted O-methyltransferase YrrM
MSLAGFLRGNLNVATRSFTGWWLSKRPAAFGLQRSNWERSLSDPNAFYLESIRFFRQQLPEELVEHRRWFQTPPRSPRGFGEDAFHVLWYLLLEEFKPANFLEIGVFRGQVISLIALWARMRGTACEIHGISPFTAAEDSVSAYPDLDYYQDTLANFDQFRLPRPQLLRDLSTAPEALELVRSRGWEMIYIDGNHDYEIAHEDWEACSRALKPGGIVVLDDAGLSSNYHAPVFASGGHPGPSRVAREIDRSAFREILQIGHNRAFQKIG